MSGRDDLSRFLIESTDVRGLLVHLDETWQTALARVDYPDLVKEVLGQAFAATVLLASTIKFDGRMTLQVRGDGPVHLLVVQITADRKIRGLARWKSIPTSSSLPSLFGTNARMSITIEATKTGEPYQGVVALEGQNLSDAIATYFRNSEQLETDLVLAVGDEGVAGLLLQKLPGEAPDPDGWERTRQLGATLTHQELLSLPPEELLHRLFHQEQVRFFGSESVIFECACSRARSDSLILGLGSEEAEAILEEQGQIEITCEFCDAQYRYDAIDVGVLFAPSGGIDSDPTVH
ncbi:MAG: Hsp33 family molecular chaperone HslO [Granulosicoccus sp.]|nr:Hsp33 family molecular chaperone HslO [Granulosicoccus sp.]